MSYNRRVYINSIKSQQQNQRSDTSSQQQPQTIILTESPSPTGDGNTVTHHITMMNQSTETIEMIDDGVMTGMSDDDDDEGPSSPESAYNEADMMQVALDDEVTAQLAAAGPVGVAAAAAIASAKKRKRPHSFETNPSIRKRQQNRLLRKLRQTIYEFTTRVGQQAVVLVATPGKPNTSYKVFGAKPLEDVVKNLRSIVMEELESALAQQAPPPPLEDPSLFELPPLIIDGIPTPVEKMTQAQLRAFIPLMLKYSTGRGKPGWGRESTRPAWWPKELPWANVRMDARTEDDKQKISWTHALRKIVINCYKFHGREDLLPAFSEEDEKANQLATSNSSVTSSNYTQTMIHSIQNADGTVSIIQVDPNNQIITLPDGTTAQVQGVATLHTTQGEGGNTIHTVQGVDSNGHAENMTVDLTEATLGQDGQLIITGEDGHGYPVSVSGMITLPVSSSVYQTMVANIQQLHSNSDGTLCITPMQVQTKMHPFGAINPSLVAAAAAAASAAATSGNTTTTTTTSGVAHINSNNNNHHISNNGSNHHHNNNNNNHMSGLTGLSTVATAVGSGFVGIGGQLTTLNPLGSIGGPIGPLKIGRAAMFRNFSTLPTTATTTTTTPNIDTINKHCRTTVGSHHNNNNNNHNNNNNNNNNNHVLVPKIELADSEHSQAVIDADGNIIISFGNSAPIKIECDSNTEVKS